jgi:oligosaccharide repeat unit polymerase
VLSPLGVFTFVGFLGFGLSIPLIAAHQFAHFELNDEVLSRVFIVYLLAQLAFTLGYISKAHKVVPTKWLVRHTGTERNVSIPVYIILALGVAAAGFTRAYLHLGEAGVQPEVPYAGQLQYVLYHGTLIFCLWFLGKSLRTGKLYVILALTLLLGVAVTQALLGWRGGIVYVIVLAIPLFWYQEKVYQYSKAHSPLWIGILLFFLVSIMQLGSQTRVERLGGESQIVQDNLLEKMLIRAQGTTRLAAVIEHFGPLSVHNDFFGWRLHKEGLSTGKYVDREIYGVAEWQSHGVGTSGPGGPYIAMGMIGVLIGYGTLGIFFRASYNSIFGDKQDGFNILGVVFYALLIGALLGAIKENYGISTWKFIVAIMAQIFVYKHLFFSKHRDF